MLRAKFAAPAVFALFCLFLSVSAASAQSTTYYSYCHMGPYGGSNYYSEVFPLVVRSSSATPTGEDKSAAVNPARAGFMEDVHKKYSLMRPRSTSTCPLFTTQANAAADKKKLEAEYAKMDYKIIETGWKP